MSYFKFTIEYLVYKYSLKKHDVKQIQNTIPIGTNAHKKFSSTSKLI